MSIEGSDLDAFTAVVTGGDVPAAASAVAFVSVTLDGRLLSLYSSSLYAEFICSKFCLRQDYNIISSPQLATKTSV